MENSNANNLTEEEISTKEVFSGRLVHLYRAEVKLPNGDTSVREFMRHPGAVAIIPIDDENNVTMVKQFRYPLGRVALEVPAGKLEEGEEVEPCAVRELSEETGITAEKYTYLGCFLPAIAISDELIHIYIAEKLAYGKAHTDADEFINTVKLPLDEALNMVFEGKILDGKTQIALMKAKLFREQRAEHI